MKEWVKNRLVEDAHQAHKMWSVRSAVFWAGFAGFWAAFPAFQNFLPPLLFAGLSVVFSIVFCIARLTNQPGLEK